MPTSIASEILLRNEQGFAHLQAFALANEIDTFAALLSFPLSALATRSGYSIQVQNEIIELATRHNMLQELKQY